MVKDALYWNDLHMGQAVVPKSHVGFGEHVRLVINYRNQVNFMHNLFAEPGESRCSWPMWLQADSEKYRAGTEEFMLRLGSMIRHHGLLANLSLRENLLLPFLYRGDQPCLERAEKNLMRSPSGWESPPSWMNRPVKGQHLPMR